MAKSERHATPELIEKHCGYINTDVWLGWVAGIGPKRKIGGRLYDHCPPEHLTGRRYLDWMTGYKWAKEYKAWHMRRRVHFVGRRPDGTEVRVVRKGWSVRRGQVVTQLERNGCAGDVCVYYLNEDGVIARTVECGI